MGLFRKNPNVMRKPPVRRSASRAEAKIAAAAEKAAEKPVREEAAVVEKTVVKEEPVRKEEPAVKEPVIKEEASTLPAADAVFHYFKEIAAIPHGSHHTEQISGYLAEFAKKRGLSYVQDDANNVIITKKASEGFENAEPVALQGHIDMVLARLPEKKIDLTTEAITILEDDDWMFADGTTLGADNGIAVAMMLALLADDSIRHPLVECIFTSDEEVGLIGATAIDLSGLKSRRLLNLDSESEGVFCAGCAGGADVVCEMPLKTKSREGKILHVKVSGLKGGHSGSDIHLGGANAIRILARALYSVCKEIPFHLVSVQGGDANNAIPTNAEARILVPGEDDACRAAELIGSVGEKIAAEYKFTDPDMSWTAETEEESEAECVSKKKTRIILEYLMALPTGITHLNPVIKGMPQTSLNMGIIRMTGDDLQIEFMVRSGVNTQTVYLCDRLACISDGFGAVSTVRSSYPAWEYRKDSPLRDLAVATYRELTGRDPEVEVIHAGLECGILSGKLPGLDCISAGPTMQNVHTVRERVSKSSVQNVWKFVLAFLEKAAENIGE